MTDTTLIGHRAEARLLGLAAQGRFRICPVSGYIWRCEIDLDLGESRAIARAEYWRKDGYGRVRAMIEGVTYRATAHRLIYRAYHGRIPRGYVIDHINGDRADNRIENLEAVTQSENLKRIHRRKKNQ